MELVTNLMESIRHLPSAAQDYMEAVWFADRMTSELPHEERGRKLSGRELVKLNSPIPSDDTVSSVWSAGAIPRYPGAETLHDIPALLPEVRKDFLRFVHPYVQDFPEQWGYAVPGLLKANQDQADWLAINHRGCGAAMRAGTLSVMDEQSMSRAAMFLGISHLHPDALAGGFAVWQACAAGNNGGSWSDIEAAAHDGAEEGDYIAHQLHEIMGLPAMPPSELSGNIIETLNSEDPYDLVIEARDYISSRYVTSAALLVAKKKYKDRNPLMSAIQMSAKLGGDPDTVAVISCGILQQRDPGLIKECLQKAYNELGVQAFDGCRVVL